MSHKIFIVSLFENYFDPLKNYGVVANAFNGVRGNFDLIVVNPRDYSPTNYKGVDDTPFGGGAGMIMRADILAETIDKGIIEFFQIPRDQLEIICTSPRGKIWQHSDAMEMAKDFQENKKNKVFICGRYEGIDERFLIKYVDRYISVGDYILSGGELAVTNILDSSLRLVDGILGSSDSYKNDSFFNGLIEYPLYTKPREFQGMIVPEILTGGHHANIKKYQEEEAIKMTKKYRPDLLEKRNDKN